MSITAVLPPMAAAVGNAARLAAAAPLRHLMATDVDGIAALSPAPVSRRAVMVRAAMLATGGKGLPANSALLKAHHAPAPALFAARAPATIAPIATGPEEADGGDGGACLSALPLLSPQSEAERSASPVAPLPIVRASPIALPALFSGAASDCSDASSEQQRARSAPEASFMAMTAPATEAPSGSDDGQVPVVNVRRSFSLGADLGNLAAKATSRTRRLSVGSVRAALGRVPRLRAKSLTAVPGERSALTALLDALGQCSPSTSPTVIPVRRTSASAV